jgi:hypothetical protein
MIITAMSRQLSDGLLEELKDAINAPTNLNIIPTSVHEQAGGILPHRTQTLICFSRKELLRMLHSPKTMPKRNSWYEAEWNSLNKYSAGRIFLSVSTFLIPSECRTKFLPLRTIHPRDNSNQETLVVP